MDSNELSDTLRIPRQWEPHAQGIEQLTLLNEATPDTLTEQEREQWIQLNLGNLRKTYQAIQAQATRLRERVAADRLQGDTAVMMRPATDDNETARAQAVAAVNDWFFRDGQDEKETSVYIGAVACSFETLGAVQELNRLKSQFSECMASIRNLIDHDTTKAELTEVVAALTPNAPTNLYRKAVGETVRHLIHPRLNIRQLVRHIPVVPVCPDRIRWRWTLTPSTMKITRSALVELLEARTDIEARYDLAALAHCYDPEFSWRKGTTEDCRMSVLCRSAVDYFDLNPEDDNRPQELMRNLSLKGRMPVFYLSPRLAPYIKPPSKRKNASAKSIKPQFVVVPEEKERREREGKVEKQPFLQSLQVHRYLKYTLPETEMGEPGLVKPVDSDWTGGFAL